MKYSFLVLLIISSLSFSDPMNYRPEFEKEEVYVILKKFKTMKALKGAYKAYRAEWITKHPNDRPPPTHVSAWSGWGFDEESGVDYCVIYTVEPDTKKLAKRSHDVGHELWHCFRGNYHD